MPLDFVRKHGSKLQALVTNSGHKNRGINSPATITPLRGDRGRRTAPEGSPAFQDRSALVLVQGSIRTFAAALLTIQFALSWSG